MHRTTRLDRTGRLSRRHFITVLGLGASASLLAACQPAPPAQPTTAPAKPAEAPKPAEPAKPAEAPKPAGPAPTAEQKAPAAAAEQPQSGGELVFASWDEPISLDPHNTATAGLNADRLIFDTLVIQASDFKHYPALAESWEVSPDGKIYTFKLKRNAKLHDGSPVNAQAVKFSLDRVTGPGVKANFTISLTGVYETTEVVDDYTARVVMKQPFAPMLDGLADGYFAIVSPAAVEKYGKDFDRNPVGSGPYIFQEWQSKSHVSVKRNPDYAWGSTMFKHQGPSYPDRLTIRLIPDSQTRMATLETGEIQVAEMIPPEEVDRLKQNPKLQIMSQVAPGTAWQLQINTTQPPLDDLRLRQALEYAVNQEDITKVLFKGALPAAHAPLAKGTLGYDDSIAKMYSFDPARAKAALEQAGWKPGGDGIREKDGKKLNISINIVSSSIQALPIKMAELVQAQLRDVGIFLEIRQTDTAALFAIMNEGSQQIIYGRRGGSDPDVIRPLFHSSFFGKSPVARIRFKDDRLDQLLSQGSEELDRTKRQAIYKEIQEIIFKNALVVPLWDHTDFVGAQAGVRGVSMDPHGYVNLYDAWVAKS